MRNARLLNETRESLAQQTATSEVLQVISTSPGDLEPVFAAMLENAVRICDAKYGNIYRWDGEALRIVATHNMPAAYAEARKQLPFHASPDPVGRMIATKVVTHVADLAADPGYLELYPQTVDPGVEVGSIRTLLCVPILKDNALIGAFTINRQEVRPFTDKQIALVTSFAAQAVIAIENTRLLSELRESLAQQTATADVLRVISSSPGDLEPVFTTMLENATRLCAANFGVLHLYEGGAARAAAMHNVPAAWMEFRRHEPMVRFGAKHPLARIATNKRVLQVADIRTDVAYREGDASFDKFVDTVGARTLLVVPMLKEEGLIGAISIYRQEVRPFTDKQIALVTSFADQAVIAIENARLLSELRQRTDELGRSVGELRALGEVSQAVNSTLDLETVLSTIVAKAVQLSNTDAGAIYVYDEADREFHLRATYGMDQELIDALGQARLSLVERNVALLLAEREPIQVADLTEEVLSDIDRIIVRAGYRARLAAPLFRGDDIVGLLVVRGRTPGAFPQSTVDLVKTFAAQSVVAIQNARLFETSKPVRGNWQDRWPTCALPRTASSRPRSLPPSAN
jgi:GAF domain-containing protein